MQARFHVFSGTGNTMHAAKQFVALLGERGFQSEILEIDRHTEPPGQARDVEIFMFPVYATGVPQLMQAYLRRFRDGGQVRAAVISVNGRISLKFRDGYEGQAPLQARRILKRRGYDVFLTDTLDYPHNVTNFIPPSRQRKQEAIIDLAQTWLVSIANRLARGERSIRKCHILNQAWTWVFNLLYIHIGRRFMGKLFITDAKCNACGTCARACPTGAIRMARRRPRWNWSCQGCERCINICPRRAIQTSAVRLIALIAACFYNPLYTVYRLIPQAVQKAFGSPGWIIANLALGAVFYIALVYLLDKVLFLLQMIPGLRRVLELSHTSLFGRYQAPGFAPRETGAQPNPYRPYGF